MSKKEERFIKRGKRFAFVMSLLCLVNIIILIGRNPSYALFRRTVSSKRVIEIHTPSEFPNKSLLSTFKKSIISHTTDGVNLTVEDEDGTIYLSGTNDQINFNYVWYSGKLWRITAINKDDTIKMITQDAITSITWNTNTTYSKTAWIYQWLNEDFLDTLENQENIIVQNTKWNATETTSYTTKIPETTPMVDGNIGLLNAYEYYQSYKNLGTGSSAYKIGYLNIGYEWWLITPYSTSQVRYVCDDGDLFYISPSTSARGVRPSVNLKSDVKIIEGDGTKENPYRIEGDKEIAKVNEKLNSRISGEYVNFDGKKYRIVGIENETTKLTSVDYIRDDDGAVMTKNFGNNSSYSASVTSNNDNYWGYYLNNTWYKSINLPYKNLLVVGTYYFGQYSWLGSYKNAICETYNTTERTNECSRYSMTWTGKIGLPRVGEMFSAQLGEGSSTSTDIWLITRDSSDVWHVYSDGGSGDFSPSSILCGVRPSISLKSDVLISGGEGTFEKPYELNHVMFAIDILKETMDQKGGIIGVTTSNKKTTNKGASDIREYRYSGKEVKNYVTFNNELWRILGIFKDDSSQEHLKIVRDDVLSVSTMPDTYVANGKTFKLINSRWSGNAVYWDYDGSTYDNNWADAGLMNWLNSKGTTGGYLNSLTSTAQGMIEESKWYLGTLMHYDYFDMSAAEAYEQERDVKSCNGNTGSAPTASGCRVWSSNAATWTGKIALMYPSDYGYSTDSSYWTGTKIFSYNDARLSTWLQTDANHKTEWLLSPASNGTGYVANWDILGSVHSINMYEEHGCARPTIYLKSNVTLTTGTGEKNNPYELSM